MNNLKRFYLDEHMREDVKEYLISQLNETALKKLMNKEDITGFADANDIILKAFIKLREDYGDEPRPVIQSSR